MNCSYCRKPTGSHFKVTRIDSAGQNRGEVNTCSVLCLIRWSYDYGTRQGVEGALMVKSAISTFIEMLKGAKG
jgi:hypothetical protein